MRFNLVDQIVAVEPGVRIQAVKNLTLGEEYLADHFPRFPVMPGVLMLQTLVEAGSWLWRVGDDFRYSTVVLREAKNVKFGKFMEPGLRMAITVEQAEVAGDLATFKGKGEVPGGQTVSAKFVLGRSNLADVNPALRRHDERIVEHLRGLYQLLTGGLTAAAAR
jgi:3-hydroxyacyl-[acyl-carrier-protein] dehydratase